jgi:hypothetical protein
MAMLPLEGGGAGAVPGAGAGAAPGAGIGVGAAPGPGPPQVPPAVFAIITWSAAAAGREWLAMHQFMRHSQQASHSAMRQRIVGSAGNACMQQACRTDFSARGPVAVPGPGGVCCIQDL